MLFGLDWIFSGLNQIRSVTFFTHHLDCICRSESVFLGLGCIRSLKLCPRCRSYPVQRTLEWRVLVPTYMSGSTRKHLRIGRCNLVGTRQTLCCTLPCLYVYLPVVKFFMHINFPSNASTSYHLWNGHILGAARPIFRLFNYELRTKSISWLSLRFYES